MLNLCGLAAYFVLCRFMNSGHLICADDLFRRK